jgi:hypothetical protein
VGSVGGSDVAVLAISPTSGFSCRDSPPFVHTQVGIGAPPAYRPWPPVRRHGWGVTAATVAMPIPNGIESEPCFSSGSTP